MTATPAPFAPPKVPSRYLCQVGPCPANRLHYVIEGALDAGHAQLATYDKRGRRKTAVVVRDEVA